MNKNTMLALLTINAYFKNNDTLFTETKPQGATEICIMTSENFLLGVMKFFEGHIMGTYQFTPKQLEIDYLKFFDNYLKLRDQYFKNKKPSLKLVRKLELVGS